MAITEPLSIPTGAGKYRAFMDESVASVGVSRSPFTGKPQVFAHPAKLLRYNVEVVTMTEDNGEAWGAFFKALNFQERTFLFGNPVRATPRGGIPGTPLVDGASQAINAITLDTKGWTAGQSNILRAGDQLQLGSGASARLYINVTDASSDGSGLATLDIWPGLRSSPADSAALTVTSAEGVFRLEGQPTYNVIPGRLYQGISFVAVGET